MNHRGVDSHEKRPAGRSSPYRTDRSCLFRRSARAVLLESAPIVIPIFDWTGFYVGINGGGGSAHQCWDVVNAAGLVFAPPRGMGCHDATGGTFGGQIGYRWQVANSMFGLEAQGNWADFKGSSANLAFVGVQDETKIDSFGLFTGQVGYAWNNVLLYVKGGAAVVRDKYRVFDFATGLNIDNGSETRWGGAVGTGLEFDFAPNWSLGLEYDHLFMGHRDVDLFFSSGLVGGPAGALAGTARIGQDVDIGLVRLNYRGGGAPAARY